MLGLSATSYAAGVPEDRAGAAAFGDATAKLLLSGETPTGVTGEVRRVSGLVVTNAAGRARAVEVQSVAGGQSVSANVGAGQTLTLAVPLYEVTWTASPRPHWSGLNVRWKDPA